MHDAEALAAVRKATAPHYAGAMWLYRRLLWAPGRSRARHRRARRRRHLRLLWR
jgi:hypothetical protein